MSASSQAVQASSVKTTGMAFACTGRTAAFASVVRMAKSKCSPVSGASLPARVPVQGRQSPAKANGVLASSSANQCGTFGVASVYSQNALAGTGSEIPA